MAAIFTPAASAWNPTREALKDRRAHVNEMRADKCLTKYETNYLPRDITQYWLDRKWHTWGERKIRTRELASKCIPTSPAAIIRYVFPSYAEDQAIRVAAAESTGDCYGGDGYSLYAGADNPDSTAAGLFQLLDTWWSGRTPGYPAINPYNALANTKVAYRLWLNSGGSFAHHWSASIGCWG